MDPIDAQSDRPPLAPGTFGVRILGVSEATRAIRDAVRSDPALADLWVEVANQTLVETHRTPEFLEAQRRLTRSSTECRLAEREIAEAYCEMHHIPTRTEVDELARTVTELRRDLRALRRSQQPPKARTARKRAP